ncbi:MAG: hypothetical protein Q8916_07765 [Bacteroidota bacterium]|nr:hypothetical protein [Bacteroidota bacterium]MDP4235375.1 hypothetical protein [Bacteroidota bacterium]
MFINIAYTKGKILRMAGNAIVFLSASVFLFACTETELPNGNGHLNRTATYSIRKTFRIQSSGSFPDSLAPVYPNPFNRTAGDSTINVFFTLKDTGNVKIIIQNPIGDSIAIYRDSLLPSGSFTGSWQPLNAGGERLNAGLYFITIRIAPDDANRNYINSRLFQIQSNE